MAYPISVNRRRFMAGVGASTLAFSIVKPHSVSGANANQKIKLGIVGCGGRGTWITKLFQQNGGYEIVAASDYFSDHVNGLGDLFDIPQSHRFDGLSGYQQLLEQELDAIAIETPPYFHPEQAAAGVEAGKHVYVAKPIAVDVPGCQSIQTSGKKATEKKLCFLIDFQTRANPLYQEALKRVHDGQIGSLAWGEAFYHAGCPWERQFEYLKDDPQNPENRLRAWGLSKVLSGDIITEQNIHTLDVTNWIMEKPPLYAVGTCGHKVRPYGDCNDYFCVEYQYPDDVAISFTSRQFDGFGAEEGIKNRMFGTQGVLETNYFGSVLIRGKNPMKEERVGNLFTDGVVTNIATFRNSILNGNYENPTVEPSVRSNLLTILGRTAAYTGESVAWDALLKKNEKLEADFKGLKE